jgi:hypothetical protein
MRQWWGWRLWAEGTASVLGGTGRGSGSARWPLSANHKPCHQGWCADRERARDRMGFREADASRPVITYPHCVMPGERGNGDTPADSTERARKKAGRERDRRGTTRAERSSGKDRAGRGGRLGSRFAMEVPRSNRRSGTVRDHQDGAGEAHRSLHSGGGVTRNGTRSASATCCASGLSGARPPAI